MRALAVLAGLAGPATADEVEDAIAAALEAYRAGDMEVAKEELDYAKTLLDKAKAQGLAQFLPPALAGWSRTDAEPEALGAMFLGGGLTASATYEKNGASLEVQLMADNPMVATMGAMLATPSVMAMQGDVRRLGRMRYLVTHGGEVMALVDNRILVQVTGGAPEADKIAYFEAIDFEGLSAF
jgi:hypothetical protein